VARTFVRPESYTLDIDRLLLGREAAFRTASVGVLHIIIHSAEGLPKVDTVGTCDPYVAVGFAKYHKPSECDLSNCSLADPQCSVPEP
jgi:Ca2+-dependent lipid-binding protein